MSFRKSMRDAMRRAGIPFDQACVASNVAVAAARDARDAMIAAAYGMQLDPRQIAIITDIDIGYVNHVIMRMARAGLADVHAAKAAQISAVAARKTRDKLILEASDAKLSMRQIAAIVDLDVGYVHRVVARARKKSTGRGPTIA